MELNAGSSCRQMSGAVWSCLELSGAVWSCLELSGAVWSWINHTRSFPPVAFLLSATEVNLITSHMRNRKSTGQSFYAFEKLKYTWSYASKLSSMNDD